MGTQQAAENGQIVAHALTSAGADAMGGTDCGTPLVTQSIVYNPHRTLEKDHTVSEGFKPDDVVDALHGPTGNKDPLVVQTAFTQNQRDELRDLEDVAGALAAEPASPRRPGVLTARADSRRARAVQSLWARCQLITIEGRRRMLIAWW